MKTLITFMGAMVFAIASFAQGATDPKSVTFLGTEPEADEWTYAQDVMGWDVIFKYSDTVDYTAATATIGYFDEFDDSIATPATVTDLLGRSNLREGYFGVFIAIPEEPIYNEGMALANMTITLKGLTYNGEAVPDQTVTFIANPNPVTFRAPATKGEHGGGTTGIQAEQVNANKLVNIYSVQGILLKKNVPAATANTLSKGLYIVDGEKVIVK